MCRNATVPCRIEIWPGKSHRLIFIAESIAREKYA